MNTEIIEYAATYQRLRKDLSAPSDGMLPPMEFLRHNETDELHLSVSFSATGASDLYFSSMVSKFRAVKIKMKWLILPTTVSSVMDKTKFLSLFGDIIENEKVGNHDFYVIRATKSVEVKQRISELDLSNQFREEYRRAYCPGG